VVAKSSAKSGFNEPGRKKSVEPAELRVGVRQMARERELDRALQLLDAHGDLSSRLRAYGE